jgi:hypothetical protein
MKEHNTFLRNLLPQLKAMEEEKEEKGQPRLVEAEVGGDHARSRNFDHLKKVRKETNHLKR